MSEVWAENPTYSHGYLVPLFSLGLLWWNRRQLAAVRFQPSWWGVAVIALAGVVQFTGLYFFIPWLEGASLMVFLAGVALLLGGRPLFAATWKSIAFLVFMIPLPWTIESALRSPLRLFAAQVSNWLLQLLGLASVAEGTIIDVNGHKLGVEDACSGIAMLMTFLALAVGLAIIVRRPRVDKLVIILSAIPIAILCNVLRITATGVLYATVGEKVGKFVYHDLAGFLMMPLGIALLWFELFVLDHLLVTPQAPADRPFSPLVIPGLSQPPVRRVGRT
jgi:exosortase